MTKELPPPGVTVQEAATGNGRLKEWCENKNRPAVSDPPFMSRNRRTDDAYEIEALTKGIAVIEALEGTNFEPVPTGRIVQRTQLSRDTVERSLKTLRLRGWAVQNERGEWMIGKRFIRFAAQKNYD